MDYILLRDTKTFADVELKKILKIYIYDLNLSF